MCCPVTGLKVKLKLLLSSVTWGALDFTDSNLSFGDMEEELFLV